MNRKDFKKYEHDIYNNEYHVEDTLNQVQSRLTGFKDLYIRLAVAKCAVWDYEYQTNKTYRFMVNTHMESLRDDVKDDATYIIKHVVIALGCLVIHEPSFHFIDDINHRSCNHVLERFKRYIKPLTYQCFDKLNYLILTMSYPISNVMTMITKVLKAVKTEYGIDVQLPKFI